MSKPHEDVATATAPITYPKPYRWGRFQGWFLIAVGLLMTASVLLFLGIPESKNARALAWGFAWINDLALGLVNTGREIMALCDVWASPSQPRNVEGALGMLARIRHANCRCGSWTSEEALLWHTFIAPLERSCHRTKLHNIVCAHRLGVHTRLSALLLQATARISDAIDAVQPLSSRSRNRCDLVLPRLGSRGRGCGARSHLF